MVTRVAVIPAHLAEQAEAIERGTIGVDTSANQQPSTYVHSGPVRFNAGGEVEEQGRPTRHTVSFDGVPGGSVMATRQRVNGADTVELIPGVPGSRTHLREAVRSGLIKESASGVFEDVRQSDGAQRTFAHVQDDQQRQAVGAQQAAENQRQADDAGIFVTEEDQAFAAEFANIPEYVFRSATAAAVKALVLSDEDFEGAAMRLAKETGMEPSIAAEKVGFAVDHHQRIVDRAMEKVGIKGEQLEQCYADLRDNPGTLQDALQYLVHAKDVSKFQAYGRQWLERTERVAHVENDRRASSSSASTKEVAPGMSEASLRAAGFETTLTPRGVLMVKVGNGRWLPATGLLKDHS